MLLYIILLVLLVLNICTSNNTIEYFKPNPQKAGSVEVDKRFKNIRKMDESLKINNNMVVNKDAFFEDELKTEEELKQDIDKVSNKKLIYTTEENNNKIIDYENKVKSQLNDILESEINNGKVIMSVLPDLQLDDLKDRQFQQHILGFDVNIPQVVTRNKKYISNLCTGYWGDWVNKDQCKKETPCKKIYRKWNYNNLGDDEDHDCKTDRSGINNINKLIDLKDYRRTSFNINDTDDYPSNVDVTSCNKVIDYNKDFGVKGGLLCSNKGKCDGISMKCKCDNDSEDANCSPDGIPTNPTSTTNPIVTPDSSGTDESVPDSPNSILNKIYNIINVILNTIYLLQYLILVLSIALIIHDYNKDVIIDQDEKQLDDIIDIQLKEREKLEEQRKSSWF